MEAAFSIAENRAHLNTNGFGKDFFSECRDDAAGDRGLFGTVYSRDVSESS